MSNKFEYSSISEDLFNLDPFQDHESASAGNSKSNYFDDFDDANPDYISPDDDFGGADYDTLTLDDLRILM